MWTTSGIGKRPNAKAILKALGYPFEAGPSASRKPVSSLGPPLCTEMEGFPSALPFPCSKTPCKRCFVLLFYYDMCIIIVMIVVIMVYV